MTPNERKKFDEFTNSVNKEIPHPQDEKDGETLLGKRTMISHRQIGAK